MNISPSTPPPESMTAPESNTPMESAAPRPSHPARFIVLGISLILFSIACLLPALVFLGNSGTDIWQGYRILFLGWMGPMFGQFAWCANPLLLVSMVTLVIRRWVITIVVSILTLFLAANTFLLFFQEVPADEAGVNMLELQYLHVGAYLWFVSILTILIGAVILWWVEARNAKRS
jgi:hypothetical protein